MRVCRLAVSVAGLLLLASCATETPLAIRDEMATTARVQPGATTVVFFTDFQCPFCRRTHANLQPLLTERHQEAASGKPVSDIRLVIKHVPLARHPDARTAARAAVCFESLVARETTSRASPSLGARPNLLFEEYVHALMTSPDLSEGACEHLAEEHGAARDAMQRCLAEPGPDTRIENDLALFDAVHGDGVPLLFVGGTRLEGAQSREGLEAALENAKK